MYLQARSISSSIQRVGRLARPVPFRYRQSPSIGFSSGQATGSQRNSMPNSWASFRLLLAVWGEPRSGNTACARPRHWALRCLRCSWKLSWSHFWVWSRQMAPVLISSVPYKTPLFRLPIMGTSTGAPLRAHLARSGGVSVMMVASVQRITVRFLPFRPRFSPLLLAARSEPFVPAHTWVDSSGSPSLADTGAPWRCLPQCPEWPSDGALAGRRSSPRPGNHTGWAGCPSPAAPDGAPRAASLGDAPRGAAPSAFRLGIGPPGASSAGPRRTHSPGLPPTVGPPRWGVLLDPATGDPGPSGPSERPDRNRPGVAVPAAGWWSDLSEPSLPPLNLVRSG